MNVSLTPELEKFVAQKVQSGLYQTASEVIREGLRLLEERDALRQAHLDDIRQAIQDGNAQLARGEGLPGEQVFEQLRAKSRARRHAAPWAGIFSHLWQPRTLTIYGNLSPAIMWRPLTASCEEIYEVIQCLVRMPLIGHFREDLADRSHRFWPVRDFLIVYHPDTSPLEIVRILRGSRDIPSLL
jgi:antitoxin ParD1/3/4